MLAAPTAVGNFRFGNKLNVTCTNHYFMSSARVSDHTAYMHFLDEPRTKACGRSGLETLTEKILFPKSTARWVLANSMFLILSLNFYHVLGESELCKCSEALFY